MNVAHKYTPVMYVFTYGCFLESRMCDVVYVHYTAQANHSSSISYFLNIFPPSKYILSFQAAELSSQIFCKHVGSSLSTWSRLIH